jgi:hypothetical protein
MSLYNSFTGRLVDRQESKLQYEFLLIKIHQKLQSKKLKYKKVDFKSWQC